MTLKFGSHLLTFTNRNALVIDKGVFLSHTSDVHEKSLCRPAEAFSVLCAAYLSR